MKHLSQIASTPDPTFSVDQRLNIVTLNDPACDETKVYLGDHDCLTITQVTEDGEYMSIIVSREMLQNLWPTLKLWMTLK